MPIFIQITAGQVTQYLNYAFFGLIALVVIGGIIGFIKGVYKAGFKLIITGGLFVAAVLLNKQIAKVIYDLSCSQIQGVFGVNIPELLNVTGDTLGEVGVNYLISLLQEQGSMITSSPEAMATIDALILSLLSLVVFIVDVVLIIFIIAPILSFILYHCLFKFFISKRIRKKHKVRIAGAACGILEWGVAICLFLTPFTGLVNSVRNAFTDENGNITRTELDNDLYNAIMDIIEGYDNSYISQVLIATEDENGNSIDLNLLDYLTSQTIDGTEVNIFDEITNIAGIASDLISSGGLTMGDNGVVIDLNLILQKAIVSSVLNRLTASPLILRILPIAISLALSSNELTSNIDIDELDLMNIDWSSEITSLGSVYEAFYDAGYINNIGQDDFIEKFALSRNNEKNDVVKQALLKFNQSDLFNKLLPRLLIAYMGSEDAKNSGFDKIFPNTVAAYEKIKWGSELVILYDTLLDIDDLYVFQLNHQFHFTQESIDQLSTVLLNPNYLEPHFITVDSVDNLVAYGTRAMLIGNETYEKAGLLDSELIYGSINPMIDFAIENIELGELDLDLSPISEATADFDSREDWREELSVLLDCAAIIINNEDLPLENTEKYPNGLDIFNTDCRRELGRLAAKIDGSKIITALIPTMITQLLPADEELVLGLKIGDFNFAVDNVGQEILDLLGIIDLIAEPENEGDSSIMDVFDEINALDPNSSTNNILELLKEINMDTLNQALTGIYKSKIVNPVKLNNLNQEIKDDNFNRIIFDLFNSQALQDLGISLQRATLDNISENNRWVDNGTVEGEITKLCYVFEAIINADSFHDVFLGNDFSVSSIDSDDLIDVVDALAASELLEPQLAVILNDKISPMFSEMGVTVDFEVVTDWGLEARALAKSIDALQVIITNTGNTSIALDEIQWINTDPGDLKDLLLSFEQSQLFGVTYDESDNVVTDRFGDLVNKILSDQFDNYLTGITPEEKDTISNDFYIRSKTANLWEDTSATATDGELSKLAELIATIQDLSGISRTDTENPDYNRRGDLGLEKLESFDLTRTNMEALFGAINDAYILRSIYPYILSSQIDGENFSVSRLDMSKAYVDIFKNEFNFKSTSATVSAREQEVAARKVELDQIVSIYEPLDALKPILDNQNLKITDLSTEDFDNLENLLNGLAGSKVFNSKDIVTSKFDRADGDLTIYEQVFNIFTDIAGTRALVVADFNLVPDSIGENNAFVSVLKEVKNANSISPVFEGQTLNLTDVDSDEIRAVFTAVEASVLFKIMLPEVMNDNLRQSFVDLGATHVDFKTVSDWAEEGQKLGDVVDSLQIVIDNHPLVNGQKPNIDQIDWLNANPTHTDALLSSMADLTFLGDYYDTSNVREGNNFSDMMHKMITEAFVDYVTEQDKVQIKEDFDSIRVWSDHDQTQDSEINKITNIIQIIQDSAPAGTDASKKGTEGLKAISDGVAPNEKTESFLTSLNQADCLRTILPEVISTQISGDSFNVTGLDMNKAYPDVFKNELNYKYATSGLTTREQEVAARQMELDQIIAILDPIDELKPVLNSTTLKITDLSNNDFISLEALLNGLSGSRLFNTSNVVTTNFNRANGDLTIYEQVFNIFADTAGTRDFTITEFDSINDKETENGAFVNVLKQVKNANSLSPMFEGQNVELPEVISKEVKDVFTAAESSVLFKIMLPQVMNKNLIDSFVDLGATHVDFETVTNWDEEGQRLGDVIDNLQVVINNHPEVGGQKPTVSQIDWLNANPTHTDALLSSMADLTFLGDYYDTSNVREGNNFTDIMYKMMTEAFVDYVNDQDKTQIKEDFNLIRVWSSVGQTEPSEIKKITNIIGIIQDAAPTNTAAEIKGTEGLKALSDGVAPNEKLKSFLLTLNEADCLRTILPTIVSSQFDNNASNISITNLSLATTYHEIFKNELNYRSNDREVTTRLLEKQGREVEIIDLMDLYDSIVDFKQYINDSNEINFSTFDSSVLQTLLEQSHDSRIFNSTKKVDSLHRFTTFEEMIKFLFISSSMADISYDSNNPNNTAYLTDSNASTTRVEDLILDVSANRNGLIWKSNLTTTGEITRIIDIVNLFTASNLDLSGTDVIDNITDKEAFLKTINYSYLAHDMVPKFVKEVFEMINIDTVRIDVTDPSTAADYYVFENREISGSITHAQKYVEWDAEIASIIRLYDAFGNNANLDSFGDAFTQGGTSVFNSLLVPLGESEILTPVRPDFIYKIFKVAGLETYISDFDQTPSQNNDEKKRDTLAFFDEFKISSYVHEATALDTLVSILNDNKNIAFRNDSTGSGEVIDTAVLRQLLEGTVTTVEDVSYRGYIASELVASLIDSALGNFWSDDRGAVDFRSFDEDASDGIDQRYDYYKINEYEIDGIVALVGFANDALSSINSINTAVSNFDLVTLKTELHALADTIEYYTPNMGTIAERSAYHLIDKHNSDAAFSLFNGFMVGDKDDPNDDIKIAISIQLIGSPIEFNKSFEIAENDNFEHLGASWAIELRAFADALPTI